MNDATVNDAVKKPTGPKPRPPISRRRYSNDLRISFMENSSRESIYNSSLDKSIRDAMAKSNPNSPFGSEGGRNARSRRSTSYTKIYPDLESTRNELHRENESYESSLISGDSFPHSTSNSSNSSSPDKSPRKPAYVEQPERSKSRTRTIDQKQNNSNLWPRALIAIVIVFIICIALDNRKPEEQSDNAIKNSSSEKLRKKILRREVADLKDHFPSQDKWIWHYFVSGIDDVASDHADRVKPAVILLLAMNEETTDCLVKRVAEIVSSHLGGTGYVVLTIKDTGNDTKGVFELVKRKYQQTKLMVFQDILNMQPEAVSALHYICDPDHRLIEKVVYLIVMKSASYEDTEKPIHYAERHLRNSFSNSLKDEILEALITRLTAGGVLPIKEEKIIPCRK